MICITASLAVGLGVSSIIEMLGQLIFAEDLHLDLGFAAIFVGYGLFAGRQASRRWAIVLSCLFLVIQAIGFLVMVSGDVSRTMLVVDWNYFFWVNVLYSFCFVLALFVLLSKRNEHWFSDTPAPNSHSRTFVLAIAAVTAVFLIQHQAKERWIGATQAQIYAIDLVIEIYDAETGKGLNSCTGIQIDTEKLYRPLEFPKVAVSVTLKDNVIQHQISAIAIKPIEYVVAAPGFQSKTVVLDESAAKRLRVELEPIERAEPTLDESSQEAVALSD